MTEQPLGERAGSATRCSWTRRGRRGHVIRRATARLVVEVTWSSLARTAGEISVIGLAFLAVHVELLQRQRVYFATQAQTTREQKQQQKREENRSRQQYETCESMRLPGHARTHARTGGRTVGKHNARPICSMVGRCMKILSTAKIVNLVVHVTSQRHCTCDTSQYRHSDTTAET